MSWQKSCLSKQAWEASQNQDSSYAHVMDGLFVSAQILYFGVLSLKVTVFGIGALGSNSLQFSRSVVSDSLQPHEPQHARPPCPSPTPRVYSNSCPVSQWCHLTISSSVGPSSCLQCFPTSGSFQMSQLFTSGDQSIGVSASASVLPVSIWGWFLLGLTGLISFQSKGLSRVFSNLTDQKHQFKS